MTFKFLHAADLHLDSPLLGLATKSADYAARVDRASRDAFENLIMLTIDEGCNFIVIAGDILDGDLRNFETGLFFIDQMRRLDAAGIRAFLILGNHDAENRFAAKLSMSANVHVFDSKQAQAIAIEGLSITVHGRSFPQRDVTENIAREYPAAVAGHFNIGVLHTACQGSESYHALYAPCTVEQLVNHGYDYWALGHVHGRAVLNTNPHIIYPGNLQGRSSRETGPKGATIVTVSDGQVIEVEHRDLDVVRWVALLVDATGAETQTTLLERIRSAIDQASADAGDRALAVQLRLIGQTILHHRLLIDPQSLRDDVAALLATLAGDFWLEKLVVTTASPSQPNALDPTVSGRLAAEITSLDTDETLNGLVESQLAEVRTKMPAGAHAEAFFEALRSEAPARARALALSLIDATEAGDATH
ncbi:exonuclease SbcCD subunit D [Rhizobium leguminosarum]|uniref:metallophosphoesterase family protein n=1 Tax=Rhizobium leguminosarum TaxID=384 RepID=UPI001C90895C|nr:DNA repair exonuclease [Rhizobium leguminosarum]MBY3026676.1 DNA repair exonuclease [Rhizobium leguminosarum]